MSAVLSTMSLENQNAREPVDNLAQLVRSCDAVVQNAGRLTSQDALSCGAHVISYRRVAGHGLTLRQPVVGAVR